MPLSDLEHDSFDESPAPEKKKRDEQAEAAKKKMLENPWQNKALLDPTRRNIKETKEQMREGYNGKKWLDIDNPAIWIGDVDD